jgi:hypothetical protein
MDIKREYRMGYWYEHSGQGRITDSIPSKIIISSDN